ncbi:MAG: heavy metal translocating P-type ATPase [Thermoplasmata archaeon]|nr:heavy metal translocating P-type ATPase [Thermoplasmata archaeon]
MDVLVATATSAAFVYSAAALLLPGRLPPALYFDASSLIVTLILTGNYLELRTRERATGARRRLAALVPGEVTVVENGLERRRPIREIETGARLRVRPGERLPVDGIVREGRSSVDESWIAGESRPVDKSPGAAVVAGSMNLDGLLDVEATRTGDGTYLAEVGRLLTEAELGQVPLRKTADRIAERFVPLVLAIAVAAAAFWFLLGAGPTISVLVFVTVAITACPCAFGIATPAALAVAVSQAAELGILFRGREALERAAAVDVIVADKTGTLTAGHPVLTDAVAIPGWSESDLIALAAGVERGSNHPLSIAVRLAAQKRGVEPRVVGSLRVEPGIGAFGVLDGKPVCVRRPDLADTSRLSPGLAVVAAQFGSDGKGCSIVEIGTDIVGVLGFADPVRPTIRATVDELRRRSIEVMLATGDSDGAARSAGRAAGIAEVHGRMTPADKLELVRHLQRGGRRVAFVGDGINDAPALLAADLGVAVGGGTDVAQEAGQVILVRSGFESMPAVLETGRRALDKVRQNLRWAIGYNALLIPVAAGVLVPLLGFEVYSVLPAAGALAMGLSSSTVVLNSLSLRIRAPPGIPVPVSSVPVVVPGA